MYNSLTAYPPSFVLETGESSMELKEEVLKMEERGMSREAVESLLQEKKLEDLS
jgi:hypothetical protein